MKASHCDDCNHATVKWYEYKGPPAFDVLTCAKKHKPRFYMPRNDNPMDLNWGWKRVCADFETDNAPHEGPARASCAGPLDAVVVRQTVEEDEA